MTNSGRILQMHTHKHNACKGRVKNVFTCVLCFTKSISLKSKLFIFYSQSRCGSCLFDENHTMFQCSLCKWFNWKASCIWSQTINPKTKWMQDFAIVKCEEKIDKFNKSIFDSRGVRHVVQSAQGPWCRSSLDEMHKWSRGATVPAAILLHLDGPVVQSGPRSPSILMDQPSSSTPIVHSLTSLISPLDIQKTGFSFRSGFQCTFYLHFHYWHVSCKFEDSSNGDNLSWEILLLFLHFSI